MSRRNTGRFVLIIPIAILLLLLGIYLGVAFYFHSHFFPNTTVSGIACGRQTADFLEKHNVKVGDDYLLTILDRDGNTYTLKGSDFQYAYVDSGEEARLVDEQKEFTWPAQLNKPHVHTLHTSYTFDEEALRKAILNLGIFSGDYTAPVDAAIVRSESGSYEIVPEVMGNTPVEEQILQDLTAAVAGGLEEYTLTDECYVNPEVLSTNETLTSAFAKIQSYTASTIHYEIDGVDENLTADAINNMIVLKDNYEVTIDTSQIEKFVQHLASTYNTYGDVRSFKTTEGDVVQIGGGDYGWVISKTREAAQIAEDLESGKPVSREPVYEQRALQSGLDDIGNTYAEIDYSNQHMYYYKDGELVLDSDVVTGCLSKGNGSPDGIFKIVYKERNAVLVTEGSESPVEVFMPFAYNIGFHDASWRHGNFGGEIYLKSGSHGCINMPTDKAKELFSLIEVGTPVIAYYRDKIKLENDAAGISNAYSYVKPEDKEDKN